MTFEEWIIASERKMHCGHMNSDERERFAFESGAASRDAEIATLSEQVNNALLALESISRRSYGDGDYLSLLIIIKKYAAVKAADLQEALAATEPKP